MSEKRFTIKSTATELELYDNGVKIGEFPHYEWVARPVDYVVKTLNEQQATIKQLEEDKAIAEDYANIFEKENVKLRKKLNNYKATVLGFVWIMEQNGRISGKDDDFVKDLFKLINDE